MGQSLVFVAELAGLQRYKDRFSQVMAHLGTGAFSSKICIIISQMNDKM